MKKFPIGLVWLIVLVMVGITSSFLLIQKTWQAPLGLLFANPNTLPIELMAVSLGLLPTMVVAILAGGLLGVASSLLQSLAKNSLASDSTLAVGSGAQMALLLTTLFLPSFGLYGSFWVAFIGALSSMGFVFALSLPSRMNPIVMVLSGLIINIILSAIASVLLLFYSELSLGVMVWGSGVLTQSGWQTVIALLATCLLSVFALIPIYKALTIMHLDDGTAMSLGVPVNYIRLYITVLTAIMLAVVVSNLGVIGFVGLASATLANLCTPKTLWGKLSLAFGFGALILLITSNALAYFLPTTLIGAGSLTAMFAAPLIIYLIITLPNRPQTPLSLTFTPNKRSPVYLLGAVVLALATFAVFVAPHVVNSSVGNFVVAWGAGGVDSHIITDFRLPRTLTALSAGMMLAIAGVLLQSLSKNILASPEVLGLSSATALGVVIGFVVLPLVGVVPTRLGLFGFGAVFALMALGLILSLAKKVDGSYLLLVGVAISALAGGVLSIIKVSNDPRLYSVLSYLSGSTYYATLTSSLVLLGMAIVSIAMSLCFVKSISLIGLDDGIALGRGVNVSATRLILLVLIALLSVSTTLAVGPLSFVGLMTPHLAYLLGATQLSTRLICSALLGGGVMVLADWLGRYVIFPYEIPAGTIASLVGGLYFVALIRRLYQR